MPSAPRTYNCDTHLPLTSRYEAKAAELSVSLRTIQQWVADFRRSGEAGLARTSTRHKRPLGNVDDRWVETALEVMAEQTDQSRPSRTTVIDRASARVVIGTALSWARNCPAALWPAL
jgi:transposase